LDVSGNILVDGVIYRGATGEQGPAGADGADGTANTGDVTFDGNSVIGTNPNGGDGIIKIAPGPAEFNNDKQVQIRSGYNENESHLHIDTTDNSSYDLFLGDDFRYVKNSADGTIEIQAYSGGGAKKWTFGLDGSVTFPDATVQTTAYTTPTIIPAYKGFKAHYGRMYDNTNDPNGPINKLVIYKDTETPVSTIYQDTDIDNFKVSGLTGSDVVCMLVVISDNVTATSLDTLRTFVEAVIDSVVLIDGAEGDVNTVDNMKANFYSNFSNFSTIIPSVKTAFEFFVGNSAFQVVASTLLEGSGAKFDIVGSGADYTITIASGNGGSGYLVGHRVLVLGTSVGQSDTTRDFILTVTGVDSNGAVTSAGEAVPVVPGLYASGSWTDVEGTSYRPPGSFSVSLLNYNTSTNEISIGGYSAGQGHVVGDNLLILGSDIRDATNSALATPANDVVITVTEVVNGYINGFTVTGTLPPPVPIWPNNGINDGGDDEYDGGNYISTNLYSEIPYHDGDVQYGATEFGGGNFVVTYQAGIFGVFATGVAIDWIETDGLSGFDGVGTADTGSLYGVVVDPAITWTSPNNNVWRIETYNGGVAVEFDGTTPVTWWDATNSVSGSNNFRGAIIEYHALINGGTVVGTIHMAQDCNNGTVTHTEHMSGDNSLAQLSLWEQNNDYGKLYFSMTNGNSSNLLIQWTAKIFYGNEYYG
jgi:hypothetical protein